MYYLFIKIKVYIFRPCAIRYLLNDLLNIDALKSTFERVVPELNKLYLQNNNNGLKRNVLFSI